MEKINMEQFGTVLKDVRYAYRILALYQRRVLDTADYVMKAYNLNFEGGWAKFSNMAKHGNRAKLGYWSWDWLPMYMYQFSACEKDFAGGKLFFHILHQADTGFFDISETKKINRTDIELFNPANDSQTRLIFALIKNNNKWPMDIFQGSYGMKSNENNAIKGENDWIAKAYDMTRFVNQEKTDDVINEFNQLVIDHFGINLKG
jgi:hypothetical protein